MVREEVQLYYLAQWFPICVLVNFPLNCLFWLLKYKKIGRASSNSSNYNSNSSNSNSSNSNSSNSNSSNSNSNSS
ncbi:hypothetical protein FHG87_012851, partial [Trinorchestia longiramus]